MNLDRLPVGAVAEAVDGAFEGKAERSRSQLSQVRPDRVAIENGQETLLIPVQCFTAQTIHLGVPVREVRLQPLKLRLYALLCSEAVLICLRHVFERQSGRVKFLINSVEEFLVLGCLVCCSLDIATRILFRSSQTRSQRFHLLLGDERITNAPILDLFELPFGF